MYTLLTIFDTDKVELILETDQALPLITPESPGSPDAKWMWLRVHRDRPYERIEDLISKKEMQKIN